jgi:hypothetical protein
VSGLTFSLYWFCRLAMARVGLLAFSFSFVKIMVL